MDQLDEAIQRVEAALERLEITARPSATRGLCAAAPQPSAEEWDAVGRRIDAALAKARAAHAALD